MGSSICSLIATVTVRIHTFLVCQLSAEFHYVYERYNIELKKIRHRFKFAKLNVCILEFIAAEYLLVLNIMRLYSPYYLLSSSLKSTYLLYYMFS